MLTLPGAFAAMAAYRQFIVYKTIPGPKKAIKFPCDFRTGDVVSAHDSQVWTDAGTAIAAAVNLGQPYGVAFVFTELDPFWFLDIDNCLQADGNWSPIAVQLCQYFAGAAVEVSHSGRGLHIFGSGRPPAHKCRRDDLGLEFYTEGRFVALTGTGAVGDAAADFTHVLPAFVEAYFKPTAGDLRQAQWSDGPVPEWNGPKDDAELLRRALRSKSADSAFGTRASFADLFECNVPALCEAFPDPINGYNASQADAALAQHLAFWTGCDCERIARIMRTSGLNREKWEREDYLPRTIGNAVALQGAVLMDKEIAPPPGVTEETGNRPTVFDGKLYASPEEQLTIFAGCVYIQDVHRVLTPLGVQLKPEQFKVAYGGQVYQMDYSNEKNTRCAWEALTQNTTFRCVKVDRATFRPELPFGTIVEVDGQRMVNTYLPVDVPRAVGDPQPFIDHLEKVLPDYRDRYILLCYMAACVQHKGVKFQWAPLLQGVEGNGKTLFTRCVAEAVGRRYVHWPKASQIAKNFNAWMVGKVFYGVEDIYVPDSKREIIEELKPMITGEDLEIEGKGVDQITREICGNFMFNSNHKDAIKKTKNDRRFCVLYCAQQSAIDLQRDGMTGSYFPKLYHWLKNGGYAIVSELLHTMPIPDEYNPATGLQRAPVTTSTFEAVAASEGGVEQEIREAIAQELPGFCGGYISSMALDKLLMERGMARRLTHLRRKDILGSLGYIVHPGLKDGRVDNLVLPDNGKPRLFIHEESPLRLLTNHGEIARNYESFNAAGIFKL